MKVVNITTGPQIQYSNWIRSLERDALLTETMNIILLATDESGLEAKLLWKRRACCSEWIRRDGDDTQYCLAMGEAAVKREKGEV
jgi:hypothetical protein